MKKSDELRKDIAQLVADQEGIMNQASAESRGALNDQEQTAFEAKQKEIDELRKQLKTAETFEENQRQLGGRGKSVKNDGKSAEEREMDNVQKSWSLHRALRCQLGKEKLDGAERELHEEFSARAAEANVPILGIAIPQGRTEKRAGEQSVTGDSGAYGGNLVASDHQSVIEFLRPKPILSTLGARELTGLKGNLVFPTNDGGITATWEGEMDTVDSSRNAYGKKEMKPNRLAATVQISMQNIIQSSYDLERMTAEEIGAVIGNKYDEAAINGSGSGMPTGILNTVGIGSVVGGTNGAVPTWEHVVDLANSIYVNNASTAKLAYLINAKTRGKLKKTLVATGVPGFIYDRDQTIDGYAVGMTNLVPSNLTKGSASGVCSAGIFGDFNELIMGYWAFMDLSVDDKSQKKNGLIEVTVNSFGDILVRQPKAFAAIKDWLTT